MRSIVCHKVGIDQQNPKLGRALEHACVCDCVRELRLRLRAVIRSYSASNHDIPMAHVDLQVALLDARVSSLLKGMMHFLRIDLL